MGFGIQWNKASWSCPPPPHFFSQPTFLTPTHLSVAWSKGLQPALAPVYIGLSASPNPVVSLTCMCYGMFAKLHWWRASTGSLGLGPQLVWWTFAVNI